MLRALVSIIIGALVTFGLFWFMAALVGGGAQRADNSTESPVIEITMDRQDAKAQNKPRVVPKPPPPPEQPPKPDMTPPDTSSNVDGALTFNSGALDAGGPSTGLKLGSFMKADGDATPIVRIEPQYPIQAARDGKEGWVQLRFTINEIGGVDDVEVIAAEPKRLFDKEAIRALKKWKYKPKIVEGQPQKQTGQTVQLDFKLDKGAN